MGHSYLYKLISYPYNFFDEELVDIFIAFLKSLSIQLAPETVKYFHNENQAFPLFEKAIMFYNHPEMMVRNAIRIIALNVIKCN